MNSPRRATNSLRKPADGSRLFPTQDQRPIVLGARLGASIMRSFELTRVVLLAAALSMAANVDNARADVRAIYETGGKTLFSIAVPDGWVLATGGSGADGGAPRILGMNPEGDLSLWVGFLSPAEPKDLEEAEAYVKELGKNLVSQSKVDRVSDGKLGPLPARFYLGRGTREGAPVEFGVAIAALPGPRAVICVSVGEYGAREEYREKIAAIIGSLRAEAGSQ